MNYRMLTNVELLRFAEQDPRYQFDALYTECVIRLRATNARKTRPLPWNANQPAAEHIDARR